MDKTLFTSKTFLKCMYLAWYTFTIIALLFYCIISITKAYVPCELWISHDSYDIKRREIKPVLMGETSENLFLNVQCVESQSRLVQSFTILGYN